MDNSNHLKLGNPKISDFISHLEKVREIYGELEVCGAYDGWWRTPVELLICEDRVVIGSIS